MSDESKLPPCGLYRTSIALGDAIAAGQLVYFHNHSDDGGPIAQTPHDNRANRWSFHQHGQLLSPDQVASLRPLKPEGFYRLREHFHPDETRVVAADSLVQLGYNRAAEPIIFFPKQLPEENALAFPTSGMRVSATVYALLEPVDIRGPVAPRKLH